MKNKVKNFSSVGLILVAIIITILSVTFLTVLSVTFLTVFRAKAEETMDLEAKSASYTSTDYVKNEDLSDSSKTVRQAAIEIMNMDLFDVAADLPYIVPAEYLRCNMEEKYFQYCGQEYGFAVIHEQTYPVPYTENTQGYLWVYLFDITWRPKSTNQPSVRIEPILTQSFEYFCTDEGEERWEVVPDLADRYFYIANVGFDIAILNENALNYGDDGYDKYTDEGIIIQQNILNYSGVKSKDNDWSDLARFSAGKILGAIPGVNDIYSIYSTGRDLLNALITYEQDTEPVVCDNSNNIFTEKSKEEQKANVNFATYTRVSSITPSEEVYIDSNGYAECITLLSDTNYRTRIIQRVRFEVISKDIYGNLTYHNADDNGVRTLFNAYNEETLFGYEDKEIQVGEDFSVYLLPQGDDIVYFFTKANGRFEIVPPADIDLSFELVDYLTDKVIPLTLENGVYYALLENNSINNGRYVLTVKSNESEPLGTVYLQVRFAPPVLTAGENTVAFNNTQREYFRLPDDFDCYYKVACEGATITFYDANYFVVGTAAVGENRVASGQAVYCSIEYSEATTGAVTVNYTREREIGYVIEETEPVWVTIDCDDTIELLTPTLSEGYAFGGWYTTNTYEGNEITASNLMSVDGYQIYLYVKRNPIVYTVTYEENGGTAVADATYTVEMHYELGATTQTGYIFSGWYESADFSGEAVELLYAGTTGNKIFYAKWIPQTFKVTLDLSDSNIGEQVITLDGVAGAATEYTVEYGKIMDLPAAETQGYTFEGWAYNGVGITNGEGISFAAFNYLEDITLTAIWSQDSYTIKIVKGDGEYLYMIGIDEAQGLYLSDDYGTCLYSLTRCPNCVISELLNAGNVAAHNLLNRPGKIYQYLGTADGEYACWNNIDIVLENNSICELSAYYVDEEYTLSFNKPDEKYITKTPEKNYDIVLYGETFTAPDYGIKQGYLLNGWTATDIKTEREFLFNYEYVPDLTPDGMRHGSFYMDYIIEAENYTITYELNLGNFPNGTSYATEYNIESETVTLSTPVRVGHRFIGWYLVSSPTDSDSAVTVISTGSTGDITLYAVWDLEYTVTINFYGWNGVSYNNISNDYIVGELVTLYNWAEAVQKCVSVGVYMSDYTYYNGTWTVSSSTNTQTYALYESGSVVSFVFSGNEDLTVNLTWSGKVYAISYKFLFGAVPLANSYVYGQSTDLSVSTVYVQHTLIGYYSDSTLQNGITKIAAGESGDKVIYLKWENYYLTGLRYANAYVITDSGRWNQDYFDVILDIPTINELEGYTHFNSIEIRVEFTLYQYYDGYQYIFLYNEYSESDSEGYIGQIDILHGQGKKVYVDIDETFNIPIDSIGYGNSKIYFVLFGSSGNGEDDWQITNLIITAKLSMKEATHGI